MDIEEQFLSRLWDERRIAIHFPHNSLGMLEDTDLTSLNPDDYRANGRKAMRILLEMAENGGYICAQYRGRKNVLLGKVEPRSAIEICRGLWGDRNNLTGRNAAVKSLLLTSTIELDESQCISLLVGRPQQGTLMRWPSIKQRVSDLVEGRSRPFLFSDLSPSELETICAEFLRMPQSAENGLPALACLKLPTGKTLKDIDIFGLTSTGKPLVAQVTYHHESVNKKIDPLRKFADSGYETVLFCQTDAFKFSEGIHRAPIDRVVELFRDTAVGRHWFASQVTRPIAAINAMG